MFEIRCRVAGGAPVQIGEQLVDRDSESGTLDFGFNKAGKLLLLSIRRIREADVVDLDIANQCSSRLAIRVQPGLEPDGTENRNVIGIRGFDGNRSPRFEIVA